MVIRMVVVVTVLWWRYVCGDVGGSREVGVGRDPWFQR